ncbi:MAG: 1-deoxy-D-xylulose-5-phosphate reductoisomerase [Bacteroidetes bacterium]|nr:1-deoxy-D-xylulose-5-phosphate reductoisomerase [Bacteroidota bacterium]
MRRELVLLGSTGSIGTQALEVIALFPDRFRVRALVAHSQVERLAEQARRFLPDQVILLNPAGQEALREALRGLPIRVTAGMEAAEEAAADPAADVVISALVGFAGLRPTLAALRSGKRVALANKESLVVAGHLIKHLQQRTGASLIPIDSEHSAILQCLAGERPESVEKLILTASGGPFRTYSAAQLERVTPEQALRHPNWAMGAKITIDSATLMNKGLEVIEAYWLFGLPAERIQVLVHPQSIVHSMIQFVDGSVKAQLGQPDMRLPIQYALTYPDRLPTLYPRLDWSQIQQLDFEPPDLVRFPALGLAYAALRRGGSAPAVLNAANEVAVNLFLSGRIGFTRIAALVEAALEALPWEADPDLQALEEIDRETRQWTLGAAGVSVPVES